MNMFAARVALAGLLTVGALSVSAPAAPSPTSGGADAHRQTAAADGSGVQRVHREYGGPVVRLRSRRERLELSFHGQRGDRADLLAPAWFAYPLCGRVRLTHDGGAVARNALAHFRLPSDGTYVFRYTPCTDGQPRRLVQLTRIEAVAPTAQEQRLPRRRGVLYAAIVRVPREGLLAVTDVAGRGFGAIATKGKKVRLRSSTTVVVSPDQAPITANANGLTYSHPRLRSLSPGGRVALLQRGDGTLIAGEPVKHEGTYDGAPATPEGQLPQVLTFQGTAQSWVQAQDGSDDHRSYFSSVLLDADGRLLANSAAPGLWRLTAAGTHSLLFVPKTPTAATTPSLRAAGVTELSPMEVDGEARTFTPPAPGRAVVAPMAGYGYLELVRAYPGGPQEAFAGLTQLYRCPPWGALGCGEGASVHVSVEARISSFATSGWVYVPFRRSETAGIELRIRRTGQSQTRSGH